MQGLPRGPPRLSAKGLDPRTGLSCSPSLTQFNTVGSLARAQRSPVCRRSQLWQSRSLPSLSSSSRPFRRTVWDKDFAIAQQNAFEAQMAQREKTIRLRRAFMKEDPAGAGTIPTFLLRSCLRAGGVALPANEIEWMVKRFRGSDGRFAWISFCNALEGPQSLIHRPFTPAQYPARPKSSGSVNLVVDPSTGRPGQYSVSELFQLKKRERHSELAGESRVNTAPVMVPAPASHMSPTRPSTAGSILSVASTRDGERSGTLIPEKANVMEEHERQILFQIAEEASHIPFSRLHLAVREMDIYKTGTLTIDELQRMLHVWSIRIQHDQWNQLLERCDRNGDGFVSYTDFLDTLARDIVQQDLPTNTRRQGVIWASLPQRTIQNGFGDQPMNVQKYAQQVKHTARDVIQSRFTDMFKAFQFLDVDRSGKLSSRDLHRGLELWNIPVAPDQLEALIAACDVDRDGYISFDEFKAALSHELS